jgi:hypothetical protein
MEAMTISSWKDGLAQAAASYDMKRANSLLSPRGVFSISRTSASYADIVSHLVTVVVPTWVVTVPPLFCPTTDRHSILFCVETCLSLANTPDERAQTLFVSLMSLAAQRQLPHVALYVVMRALHAFLEADGTFLVLGELLHENTSMAQQDLVITKLGAFPGIYPQYKNISSSSWAHTLIRSCDWI